LLAPVEKAPRKEKTEFGGIPLHSIPEVRIESPSPELKRDLFEPAPEVEEPAPPPEPSPAAETREPQEESAVEIEEIDQLIKSATNAALEEEPDMPLLHRRDVQFPAIQVKGIIFFSDGSSSNHIFVSTPQTSNRKLKVGDTVENATLDSITSQAAIFLYRGDRVEISIGH
jgi:hypothetical protein